MVLLAVALSVLLALLAHVLLHGGIDEELFGDGVAG
jgi:hypothetical protein